MRFLRLLAGFMFAVTLCFTAEGATGRIKKVLPLFVDQSGRESLSPSLFSRDAYQVVLRDNPAKRSGLKFTVNWKSRGPCWDPLTVRVEMRGIAEGALPREKILEKTVKPGRWFSSWSDLFLTGEQYERLGEVTAWRVTLWEGDRLLDEEKSFLW